MVERQIRKINLLKIKDRKAGSAALIDEDDLRILSVLTLINNYLDKNPHFKTLKNNLKNFTRKEIKIVKDSYKINQKVYLTSLEAFLKISRKSILAHITKMERFGWVILERSPVSEEYKQKVISISKLGVECFEILCRSEAFYEAEDGELYINLLR
jgi:DNA-binding MarR family transcriptional regulator